MFIVRAWADQSEPNVNMPAVAHGRSYFTTRYYLIDAVTRRERIVTRKGPLPASPSADQ